MKVRIAPLPAIGLLVVLLGAYAAVARGGAGPDDGTPIIVGAERVSAAALEQQASLLVGGDAARMASARVWAADRMVEGLWLRGEAARHGIDDRDASLATMRGRVADAIAGGATADQRLLSAFQSFHRRWRARTSCASSAHDPYADRCSNLSPASDGGCRWMGRASLCWTQTAGRRVWLVVETRGDRVVRRERTRSRRAAVATAADLYRAARARRRRSERVASLAQARRRANAARRRARADQARRRAQAARMRRQRLAAPELSLPTLRAAKAACRRYRADIDPYLFGAGLQDLQGQAEGFLFARRGAARRLARAATDATDRKKLAPLLARMRAGDRHLVSIDRAAGRGDLEIAYAQLSMFDSAAKADERLATRLGLKGCIASPTR